MKICFRRRCHLCWPATLLSALVVFLLTSSTAALAQSSLELAAAPSAPTTANSDCLPNATNSPDSARLFEEGLHLRYDFHTEQALDRFREATRKDPNFARAWAYIVLLSTDPVEAKWAGEKAQLASQNASAGDKLLVKWVTSTEDGHFLEAIRAMNDLIAICPHDAQLNYEAGLWVRSQGDGAGAVRLTRRALEINPDFAGALNTLAYQLAAMNQFEEAFTYLKRYIELEPKDPNPYDSMAEILQRAGHLEESLAEYREALNRDPQFFSSQKGLGDDYALLGDQDRARQEYAKALPMASIPQQKLDVEIQSAITYAREGNRKQARVGLVAVLQEAAKLQLNDYQSLIHQNLALLAESPAAAFQQLDSADAALQLTGRVSGAKRNRLLARSLELRAQLAADSGKPGTARTSVARLQKMVATNHTNAVEQAFHGANGAVLAAEKKTRSAIEELEQDPDNPVSMAKFAELQAASGNSAEAGETRALLRADYSTTLEDWQVARKFRPR
jgi:tetratricopeptide (TPR) repeat protein